MCSSDLVPAHMIPSAFVWLDALPLTANGKLDVKKLPPPESVGDGPEELAPRNHEEQRIAEVWSRVLQRPVVSVHEDFFTSGGHSLLALRMLTEIRAALGVEIPARRLFETPTIEGLATFVREHATTDSPEWKFLVQVQRGDTARRPLFLVPGGWEIGRAHV